MHNPLCVGGCVLAILSLSFQSALGANSYTLAQITSLMEHRPLTERQTLAIP